MLIILNNHINFLNKTIKGKIYDQDTLIVEYKVQYPQFLSISFSDRLSRINLYYADKIKQFQEYAETYLYSRAVSHYDYSKTSNTAFVVYQGILTYTPTYNKSCIVSLYFDEYFYEGGAHGRTKRMADTWNLEEGNEYPITDFFQKDVDYKKYITGKVISQIKAQIDGGSTAYFDDYQNLALERFDPNNFYLTNTGMTIFYQEYDLGPYSSGFLEFEIPYADNVFTEPTCKSQP